VRKTGIRGLELGIRQREAPWSAAAELPPSGSAADLGLGTAALNPARMHSLRVPKRELRSRTPRLAFGEQGRRVQA
jgi:hypothetical protein